MLLVKSLKSNTATVFLKLDDSATTLTTGNGWPLEPGEAFTIVNNRFSGPVGSPSMGVEYWCAVSGITTAGTADIRFVEVT